ncbi:hypothetical protein [Actinomadura montaniterrae]|uniref:Sulfotransferase family protein n=1 Tax=Actinomadura montaniterrae TaxID=1803903 RepID=A0A6L3VJ42_9ACTN|nr:hypothetical protein [Actinomadura montaniterrae]KAB2370840.1 hypothetical protein F9B16_33980 [Actinomadura montaniterrae]
MAAPHPGTPASASRPVVYIHVGAAKSGTTYLQNILFHNRERLREAGFLYPGHDFAAHVRAAFDLRETFFPGASDPFFEGAWPRMVEEIRAFGGPAVISQELFAPALRRHTARALADLDFAEVHLVFTVRDLARQIPAHWQEDIKNRFTVSFAQFMSAISRPDWRRSTVAGFFWTLQDPLDVLARWGENLPPERVHLVTLPRPGAPRDLLWKRFSRALGLPAGSCDLTVPFDNPSLGLPETQLLLRINRAIDQDALGWHFYNDEIKLHLAQRVLTGRTGSPRIRLPEEDFGWVAERAAAMVDGLAASGWDVVGDLDELRPDRSVCGPPGTHPDDPDWAGVIDASGDAVGGVLRRLADVEAELARTPDGEHATPDLIDLVAADAEALRQRIDALKEGTVPAVRRAVRQLSERHAVVARLREAYWQVQEERRQADAARADAGQTSTR